MSARISHLMVVLESDLRDDDVEEVVQALRMIRGVADAVPKPASTAETLATIRVRLEMQQKILAMLEGES